jgi:hypothetical protein
VLDAVMLRPLPYADPDRLVAAGLAAGWIIAFGLTQLVSKLLFGVSATDPVTIVALRYE